MKIDSFDVSAQAQRSHQSIEYASARFTAVDGKTQQQINAESAAAEFERSDASARQNQGNQLQDAGRRASVRAPQLIAPQTPAIPSNATDLKINLLEEMIFALTGKRIKVTPFDAQTGNARGFARRMGDLPPNLPQSGGAAADQTGSGGVKQFRMESEQFRFESESVSYTAQAQVKTADGRSISVDLSMNMSRTFMSYEKVSVQMESAIKDPIMINYGGDAASLRGESFSFDLDFDGAADDIHFAGEGSGFLALDKNGDGSVNDGSELFGPATGSGFAELRAHDGDKNGWIDENDAIFSKLLVWTKDKDGNDQLFKLQDLDIGAIHLGETQTEFALTDADNNKNGIVRSTGFFLRESGGAGTVQHVDLKL